MHAAQQTKSASTQDSGNRSGQRLVLRPGRPDDAAICATICYEAFKTIAERHAFPPDFPSPEVAQELFVHMLATPTIHSAVAELDGRVVGSNFLWAAAPVAGVGPITIAPEAQNASVGRHLMTWALDSAREAGKVSVRLAQAAYHNRSLSLYTKMGFVAREPLSTIQGPPVAARIPGYEPRPATGDDVAACVALHLRLHGYAREQELRDAVAQATAMVVEHDGRITGYTTGIGFFGHTIGESNDELKVLIGAAPVIAGPGLLLPTRNAPLLKWCLEQGLHIVQPMTLMSHGFYNEPAGAFLPSVLY